jgi:hypothetical protein
VCDLYNLGDWRVVSRGWRQLYPNCCQSVDHQIAVLLWRRAARPCLGTIISQLTNRNARDFVSLTTTTTTTTTTHTLVLDPNRYLISDHSNSKIEEYTDSGTGALTGRADFATDVDFVGHLTLNSNQTLIYAARGDRVCCYYDCDRPRETCYI